MEILVYLGLILGLLYLIFKSRKIRKKYKIKSKKIKAEIKALKLKRALIEERSDANHLITIDFYKMLEQVSDLHKLIITKYLK
ncbi:hypothetical protein C3L50_13255 [Flavobacterium alvei]|uniref:Uncharacterized protein n=1 Tax=Flavobacterium alvei TaxID=2080416 RepID=A0A2S5A6S9_9FLAO|nr:hypothetical protein [Flavobacterium alvei]POY38224.1 hypothetical protein C3L50_13255 [Flavobacterium alvei]HQE33101.1 hypothetical protein [Flavobacterium alvei]HQF47476.1 hypothetical protein [Flavobacterium alvei]